MTGHQPELLNWFSETTRDVHLQEYGAIDLCELEQSKNLTGKRIMESLLKNNELNLIINPPPLIEQKLFHAFIDQKNMLAYNNFHSLGLGFPIVRLINKKTKEVCLAPLFIWNIRLEYQKTPKVSLKIIHKKEDTIRINNPLSNFLKTNYKIDLLKLSHTLLNNKSLNSISLSKISYELSSALGKKEDLFIENIKPISSQTDQNILCSGLISNFTETLILSKIRSGKNLKQQTEIRHPFSLSILDPWQEKIFQKIYTQANTQIISEPGTGKSHLLHYTLFNALSNQLKSLVVVDSMDRIKRIRNEFSANGLDHLVLDITNPEKDLGRIIQALSFKSTLPKENFDKAFFNYLLNLNHRHQDRLDTSFRILGQTVFDKNTWSHVVGDYLKYNREERQELLENQLNAKDFTFHPTEYLSLKEAINNSQTLYEEVKNLNHPLHILHHDIFLEKSKSEAKDFVTKQLLIFYEKFHKLHHRYILKQQDYAKDLVESRASFYQKALIQIEKLKDLIDDNRTLYGDKFEESGIIQTGRLKVYGVFSEKHKNILHARNLINENYKNLRAFLLANLDGDFEIIENIDSKAISRVINIINGLEDQLYQWNEEKTNQFQEELQRLNTKSVDANLDYSEQIKELEYTLDINIEELNSVGLFNQAIKNNMLTIPKRQHFIQELIDQIKSTQNQLRDFDHFYNWQRHWLLLPEIHRKLLSALIKVNPKNWKVAFQSWYFYQRLKTDFHFKIPKDIQGLAQYEQDLQKLQALIPIQIRNNWKQNGLKRKSAKELSKLSFIELFETHFQLLIQEFPVIVMTEPVAALLLPNQSKNFDLGFLFTNEQSQAIDNFSSINIAKHTIVFTPSSGKKQVLNTSNNYLHFIHKKNTLSNFEFSNKVIYQNQKNLFGYINNKENVFKVTKVDGQFKQNTNHQEAEQIINDILLLDKKFNYQFPPTAIVCSTPEQRNYIIKNILQHSKAITLSKLMKEKKLSVFHLKEQRSNTYEYLFFSLGIHSFDHTSSELLSFLNSKYGYSRLEDLLTSSFCSIYIYHSLLDTDLKSCLSYKTKKSTRILASWIKYLEAISKNNKANEIAVLENFQASNLDHKNQLIKEIANELIPFIGKNRILRNTKLKGMFIPLLILPLQKEGKHIAILCDGSLDINSTKSHLWNLALIRKLNTHDISTIPVWSANWFENPNLEARRLASAILKFDKA